MHDNLGLYYYPNVEDTSVRAYVREKNGELEFRLWQQDRPEIWERHGWLPLTVIKTTAALYATKSSADPMRLYDEAVARALLKEQYRKKIL